MYQYNASQVRSFKSGRHGVKVLGFNEQTESLVVVDLRIGTANKALCSVSHAEIGAYHGAMDGADYGMGTSKDVVYNPSRVHPAYRLAYAAAWARKRVD